MKRITILLLSLLLCGALCAQQTTEAVEGTANNDTPAEQTTEQTLQAPTTAEELWASAGAAYSAEDYASAIASYSIIEDKGLSSAALYYNMANAYFKSEQIAKAILYYNRALRLDPSDEDIRHNLEYAEQQTRDSIERIPEFFLTEWMRSLRQTMGGDVWTILSLVALALMLAMALVYLLAQRLSLRKVGFYMMAVFALLFVLGTAFAWSARNEMVGERDAIIMSSSVAVKSSPDRSSTELFVLHEGTKVHTGETVDGWVEIRISDGRKGWIETSRMERI
jgi:tetratricopeptide (TPR) repeat protein